MIFLAGCSKQPRHVINGAAVTRFRRPTIFTLPENVGLYGVIAVKYPSAVQITLLEHQLHRIALARKFVAAEVVTGHG